MSALERELEGELLRLEERGLRRELPVPSDLPPERDFASNDVLGLARDPRVAEAAARAAREHGSGGRAARLLGGGSPLERRVERALAEWLGAEEALLLPSGWHANLGVVGALAGRGDLVCVDALAHASLIDGARLSRARVAVHAHLDLEELDHALRGGAGARRRLVLTEGVFSMDGDRAPLARLAELCARRDAWLVVDEAHALGLLGPGGAGAWAEAAQQGASAERLAARVVTGGKALGVQGGALVGSRVLRDLCLQRARSAIFTTAIAPPLAGALEQAVLLARDAERERQAALEAARGLARGLGLERPAAAVVPLVLGEPGQAVELAARVRARGYDVRAVRPPTVPAGSSRLRLVGHAANGPAQVEELVGLLRDHAPRRDAARSARSRRARLLVVAGTDTGIGKTVVSALCLRAARRLGLPSLYWKAVQTGSECDTEAVRALAGEGSECAPPHARFALPASPHEAAAAEGRALDPDALLGALEELRAGREGLVVLEPAGGLLVPLVGALTQLELYARVRPEVVLVARSGLGTLNHSLLSCEALAARHLRPRALVLVGPPHPSNRATLEALAGADAVLELPPLCAPGASPTGEGLEAWLDLERAAALVGPR